MVAFVDTLERPGVALAHTFPGLGREFMPPLDEGSFLYMPTTMPHASIGESMDAMRKQDMAISGIPEIETVVGKLGRAETALDPAPVSMVETIIQYHAMFLLDENGKRGVVSHGMDLKPIGFANQMETPYPHPMESPIKCKAGSSGMRVMH